MRFRITITYEYDANPEHYDGASPEESLQIDVGNFRSDPDAMLMLWDGSGDLSISGEIVAAEAAQEGQS